MVTVIGVYYVIEVGLLVLLRLLLRWHQMRNRIKQLLHALLSLFELLVLEIHLLPLVVRVKVIIVDHMISRLCSLLKALVGLSIVVLKELCEVKIFEPCQSVPSVDYIA